MDAYINMRPPYFFPILCVFLGVGGRRWTQVDAYLIYLFKNTYFFSIFIKIEIFIFYTFQK